MTFGLEKEGTTALKARNEITTQARLRSKSSLFREMNYCEIWFLFVLTSDSGYKSTIITVSCFNIRDYTMDSIVAVLNSKYRDIGHLT